MHYEKSHVHIETVDSRKVQLQFDSSKSGPFGAVLANWVYNPETLRKA